MLAAVAGWSILYSGANPRSLMKSIRLPLACAVSYLCVRVFIHGDSLSAEYVRVVPAWQRDRGWGPGRSRLAELVAARGGALPC